MFQLRSTNRRKKRKKRSENRTKIKINKEAKIIDAIIRTIIYFMVLLLVKNHMQELE